MKKELAGSLALALILVASAYGAPHTAGTAGADSSKQITIRIHDYAQVESSVLRNAERTTDDILQEAGVEVLWIECSAGPIPPRSPRAKLQGGPGS